MHAAMAAYLAANRTGWIVQDDGDGPFISVQGSGNMPTDSDINTWMNKKSIIADIISLESEQTPRRIREAALTEAGRLWMQNLESQISAKRAELAALE